MTSQSEKTDLCDKLFTINKMNHYSILIAGDRGVGKTTLINRHLTGEFQKRYNPTIGVGISPMKVWTNKGEITFHLYEISDIKDIPSLREVTFDGVVYMFDLTDIESLTNIDKWRDMHYVAEVLCGSKCDVKHKNPSIDPVSWIEIDCMVHKIYHIMKFQQNPITTLISLFCRLLNS